MPKWYRMPWKLLFSSVLVGNQIHVVISRIQWLSLWTQNGLCCIFWACLFCVFKNKLRLIQKVQGHGSRDLSLAIHSFWGLLGRKVYWIPFKISVSLYKSSNTINIIINSNYIYGKKLISLVSIYILMFSCISYHLKCVFPTCCFQTNKFTARDPQLHHKAFILSQLPNEILGLLMGEGPRALTLWHQPALGWKSVVQVKKKSQQFPQPFTKWLDGNYSEKRCVAHTWQLGQMLTAYSRNHLDGFWLRLKTALCGLYVLNKLAACR